MSENKKEIDKVRKLLVMRFSALGDVAMTIPVVYSLARQYPDLHIDYATTPFFARLFLNPPDNLHVHPFDLKKDYKGTSGIFRLFSKLSQLKPDFVADLHNVSRTWVIDTLFRMKGIPTVMVDKMRADRKNVIRKKTSQPSFIDRYSNVFKKLGFPVNVDFKTILPDQGVKVQANEKENLVVGIAPFARYRNKSYPIDKMGEVVSLLSDKGIDIVLFGGRGDEASQLESMAQTVRGCRSVAGKYSIEEELGIIADIDVMITMDSANHHLASLVDTPAVSIWGSTTPACGFMAYNQPFANSVVRRLDCQPCTIAGSPDCKRGDYACLDISPSEIVEKAISLIRSSK